MESLIFVKLGGSIITDKKKAFTANKKRIRALAQEIKSAKRHSSGKIFLAHGSGSFGHPVAVKYKTQEGLINKQSIKGFPLVADAAIQINRIVVSEFLKIGIPVVSFAPASFIMADGKKPIGTFFEPFVTALKIGIIPIIYGDIIMDAGNGFCIFSGEKTLALLAKYLQKKYKVEKVIHAGDTDGVYDEDGNLIPIITEEIFVTLKTALKGSSGFDVTGGMIHKVEESMRLAKDTGISSVIINGTVAGNLKKAILGEIVLGTVIKA